MTTETPPAKPSPPTDVVKEAQQYDYLLSIFRHTSKGKIFFGDVAKEINSASAKASYVKLHNLFKKEELNLSDVFEYVLKQREECDSTSPTAVAKDDAPNAESKEKKPKQARKKVEKTDKPKKAASPKVPKKRKLEQENEEMESAESVKEEDVDMASDEVKEEVKEESD
ncbi:hypothetical protein BJ508DRAFT_367674 [Ascobolus immersus RN42]|uniref:Uncharacterized protein n=1 Tax=Ascobolus immersus RN42 TaxID=1160509 RepID=A0A3N4HDA3_ASCIM|nr:hypothetical protein BJ508DRAFT_367674 [Ascobolus immersus RN42]